MAKKKAANIELTSAVSDPVENIAIPSQSSYKWLPYHIIFLCSFIIYGNTTFNEYALDDQLAIYDNKFTTQGIDGLKSIFTKDAFVGFFGERGANLISGGRYRPLSFATFAIEYQLFKLNPRISHIVNIFLFALLCMLIFALLNKLLKTENNLYSNWKASLWTIPFIATLLFLFHPIHTEVVANIKGRDEILGMLFSICMLLFTLKYWSKSKSQDLFFSFFFYFLAMLSKENSITFLGLIPIMAFIEKNNDYQKIGISLIPTLIAAILYLYLRNKYTATSVTAESPEILNNPWVYITESSQKYATLLYSYLMYFKLLIFPHPLTHDYYYNQIPYKRFSDPSVIASIIIHVGLFYFLITNLLKRNIIGFALAFYFITFSIVSNIPFTVGIIMNERFVFISSLGFCILLAYQLINKDQKLKCSPILLQTIFLVIIGLYGIKTFARNKDWKNNLTLFEADVITSNNSAKVATALGAHYIDISDSIPDNDLKKEYLAKAQKILFHSAEIYPGNSGTYLLLGNAEFKSSGDYVKSIEYFRTALKYRPDGFFDAYFNLAATYMNMKEYDSSFVYAKKAVEVNPNHSVSTKILAFAYLVRGNLDSASIMYSRFQELEKTVLFKNESEKLIYFADNLKENNQFAKALGLYEQILVKEPNNPYALFGKGLVLGKYMNQLIPSIPYMEKAVGLLPEKIEWKEDLAVAYGFTKQFDKTIPLLEAVIKAKPEYPNAYMNLATSYNLLGNKERASYYNNLYIQKKNGN